MNTRPPAVNTLPALTSTWRSILSLIKIFIKGLILSFSIAPPATAAALCQRSLEALTTSKNTRQVRQEIFSALFEDFPLLMSSRFRSMVIEEMAKEGVLVHRGVQEATSDLIHGTAKNRARHLTENWTRQQKNLDPIEGKDTQTQIAENIWQRLQDEFKDRTTQELRQRYGRFLSESRIEQVQRDIEIFGRSATHSEQMELLIRENLVSYLSTAWWRKKGETFLLERLQNANTGLPFWNHVVARAAGFYLGALPFTLTALYFGHVGYPSAITPELLLYLGLGSGLALAYTERLMYGFSNIKNYFYKRRLHRSIFAGDRRSLGQRRRDRQNARKIEEYEKRAAELFDHIQLTDLTADLAHASVAKAQDINAALTGAAMALSLRSDLIGLKFVHETAVVRDLRRHAKELKRLKEKNSADATIQRLNTVLRLDGLLRDRHQEVLKPQNDLADLIHDIDFLSTRIHQLRERLDQLAKLSPEHAATISAQRQQLDTTAATLSLNQNFVHGRQSRMLALIETIQHLRTQLTATTVHNASLKNQQEAIEDTVKDLETLTHEVLEL